MNRTAAKDLLETTFSKFKEMGAELLAYQMAFAVLKKALEHDYPGFAALSDESLAAARRSPALQEMLRQRFDEPLGRFLQQVSQAESEEEVEKLLRAMPASRFEN
jgi:hypothetical protein